MEIDPISIFVGNLDPDRVTDEDIVAFFGKHGRIHDINLQIRQSRYSKLLTYLFAGTEAFRLLISSQPQDKMLSRSFGTPLRWRHPVRFKRRQVFVCNRSI
jgi:RNA recognition motif. (a.k.a. RRM, RBD, or RNP domain)